jgi:hypothetical protein
MEKTVQTSKRTFRTYITVTPYATEEDAKKEIEKTSVPIQTYIDNIKISCI